MKKYYFSILIVQFILIIGFLLFSKIKSTEANMQRALAQENQHRAAVEWKKSQEVVSKMEERIKRLEDSLKLFKLN